jgi:hypothetical protein
MSDAAVDMFQRIGLANAALRDDDDTGRPVEHRVEGGRVAAVQGETDTPKPKPPSRGPRWFELLFRSRRWLRSTYCAQGIHVYRWWHWRDSVQFWPGTPVTHGWCSYCEVCRTAYLHDPGTPRGNGRARRVA